MPRPTHSAAAYEEALKRIAEAARTRTIALNLTGLGLQNLPPEIGQLARRHLAGLELVHHIDPALGVRLFQKARGERVEPHVALLLFRAVALDAVLRQKRLHRARKRLRAHRRRRRGLRARRGLRRAAARHLPAPSASPQPAGASSPARRMRAPAATKRPRKGSEWGNEA